MAMARPLVPAFATGDRRPGGGDNKEWRQMNILRRDNQELCTALLEQLDLLREALLGDDDEEVWRHGDALCRGWQQALVIRVQQLWPGAEVIAVRDKEANDGLGDANECDC